jgi:predicted nuclease of predicted toxin-antitoxin system
MKILIDMNLSPAWVRTQNADPQYLCKVVVGILHRCQEYLDRGALISLDESTQRIRILPIGVS